MSQEYPDDDAGIESVAMDVVASGIHDVKNMIFEAMTHTYVALDALDRVEGFVCPPEVRSALEDVSNAVSLSSIRLTKMLSAYQVLRHEKKAWLSPEYLPDLVEYVKLCIEPFAKRHPDITLEFDCQVDRQWMVDRELLADVLGNALQNSLRHAVSRIRMTVSQVESGLSLRVDDDGRGFPDTPEQRPGGHGLGLRMAREIARLHVRKGQHGELSLRTSDLLGGACFEMVLP